MLSTITRGVYGERDYRGAFALKRSSWSWSGGGKGGSVLRYCGILNFLVVHVVPPGPPHLHRSLV